MDGKKEKKLWRPRSVVVDVNCNYKRELYACCPVKVQYIMQNQKKKTIPQRNISFCLGIYMIRNNNITNFIDKYGRLFKTISNA